jgi:hypothetical protein
MRSSSPRRTGIDNRRRLNKPEPSVRKRQSSSRSTVRMAPPMVGALPREQPLSCTSITEIHVDVFPLH